MAALDAGADDYITKPFNVRELAARIRAAVRRSSATRVDPDAEIRIGTIELDPARRLVRKGGEPVHLTPKEFDLLHYLMAHPGLPVTHVRLLRAVWGPEYGGELEYLRTFVRQLRKKLETDPAEPAYLLTDSPLTPFLERVGLAVFGLSLVGLRLFSVVSQALAILVSGLMARELGGGRLAQVAAALAVALSPLPLFQGTEFQYTTFDYLWWVLIAYFTIRLLKTENPRWWLAIGAAMGLGLLTKYAIAFFIAGMLGGLLLTRERRFLRSGWFWAGMAVALAIFLPNLVWQARHGFISLHFLQHIHTRDVGEGRANGFLRDQFLGCANLFAAPLWIAGLVLFLRDRRYRLLAWMYLIPLALFMLAKGRGYYLGAAYPMLMAMGAVAAERWIASLGRLPRWTVEAVFFTGLAAYSLFAAAIILPLASGGWLKDFALRHNGDLREEIGWEELVKTVAGIRDSLPPDQRASVGVLVGNYGEQGAIEILGPAYHLPTPISGTNSAWLRGYPVPPPSTLIVVGLSSKFANRTLTGCRVVGHNGNLLGVENEESRDHPDIFVCGPPRSPWPEFWKKYQDFG